MKIFKIIINLIAIILGGAFMFTGGTDIHLGLGALLFLNGVNNLI